MTEPLLTMTTMEELQAVGWLTAGDVQFARLCAPEDSERSALIRVAAAHVSRALRQGHPCIPLSAIGGQVVLDANEQPLGCLPSCEELRGALTGADCVSQSMAISAALSTPLVLDDKERLYVARYYEHEQKLADRIAQLMGGASNADEEWQEQRLNHYFPPAGERDLQREAAVAALAYRFSVISGGPGTGKTSTVVKILALLVERALAADEEPPRLRLMAPTGKAAARMMEALFGALESLELSDEVRAALQVQATTIHRALGVLPHNATRFARGPERRMRADVVLVDEASMVDLSLMRHLVQAVRDGASLILLGDRHQLASVEAGSVLAELCTALAERGEGPQGLVELTKSYRFGGDSGIFALAQAVKEGAAEKVLAVLDSFRADLSWGPALEAPGEAGMSALRELTVAHYESALHLQDPAAVLAGLQRFRILCAHRRGLCGVDGLNEMVEQWLRQAGALPAQGEFYRGRLILITQNDYGVGLRNGDVGLCWPHAEGRSRVLFPTEQGELRAVVPAQLPAHESAFALTIHKSQGSEHDEVAVVLPGPESPLLTRELVYTGVTRAKKKAHVFAAAEALQAAAERTVTRHSGLAEALLSRLL